MRALLLEFAHCDVTSVEKPEEAIEEMEANLFDVLLLCYYYPEEDVRTICWHFRSRFPTGKIVAIESTPRNGACDADLFVNFHRPGDLLTAVTGRSFAA